MVACVLVFGADSLFFFFCFCYCWIPKQPNNQLFLAASLIVYLKRCVSFMLFSTLHELLSITCTALPRSMLGFCIPCFCSFLCVVPGNSMGLDVIYKLFTSTLPPRSIQKLLLMSTINVKCGYYYCNRIIALKYS